MTLSTLASSASALLPFSLSLPLGLLVLLVRSALCSLRSRVACGLRLAACDFHLRCTISPTPDPGSLSLLALSHFLLLPPSPILPPSLIWSGPNTSSPGVRTLDSCARFGSRAPPFFYHLPVRARPPHIEPPLLIFPFATPRRLLACPRHF